MKTRIQRWLARGARRSSHRSLGNRRDCSASRAVYGGENVPQAQFRVRTWSTSRSSQAEGDAGAAGPIKVDATRSP